MASNRVWLLGTLAAAALGFVGGGVTRGFGIFVSAPSDATPVAGPPTPLGGAPPAAAPAVDLAAGMTGGGGGTPEPSERLLARIAELERELEARPKAKAGGGPTFTFGEMGRLDAIREADWPTLAAASKVVGCNESPSTFGCLAARGAGSRPPGWSAWRRTYAEAEAVGRVAVGSPGDATRYSTTR